MTDRFSENKIILITRKTRLDDLILRFNTEAQARFYIEHLGSDFSDYVLEDKKYKSAVKEATNTLSRLGRLQILDRSFVPNFIFGKEDIIVALGQDGLVANILKYLDKQPVVGVNPDPDHYEGILLPYIVFELADVIQKVLKKSSAIRQITMARAVLNTGQSMYGVNDIFIGPKTHISARYSIQIEKKKEDQSSSGIIVSTGLGSSGWLRSVIAGATGISSATTGRQIEVRQKTKFTWESDYLYYSVREPWPSKTSSANLTFGKITKRNPLKITSAMPESGVLFSDGIETDFIEFNSGTVATIGVADKKGHLVVKG
ncbi:MAG: sugar kinase [Desulfatiglans sp.]|nr:sugar kinase [Desulfatiglans sp.]